MSKPINIIIADDHPMVREGLKVSLEAEGDINVVAAVSNGQEALDAAVEHKPDVVMLDISMPVMNGIEACKAFKAQHPDIRILIVTMNDDREYMLNLIKAGAAGYVLKDVSVEELLLAVQTVNQGATYFSKSVSHVLFSDIGNMRSNQNDDILSPREEDVLALLAEGMGNKEIARELDISVRTVEAHRMKIKQKLNISTSAGLVRYALDNGITRNS
ncbi:DNA-binding response regulator [Bacterioplanes sanyensis]|uniref:DNA-binding response regulator n=1 Tax=Bacterioplanes sanyensis TaxID=1249553 RepID=A0A222FR15_9GAMM|nr:response regulator transcription factor [Bacterioplanes sanyensis]ASP40954.1 DNA-binding response regulator [Bacterioplanes sanyensis]